MVTLCRSGMFGAYLMWCRGKKQYDCIEEVDEDMFYANLLSCNEPGAGPTNPWLFRNEQILCHLQKNMVPYTTRFCPQRHS